MHFRDFAAKRPANALREAARKTLRSPSGTGESVCPTVTSHHALDGERLRLEAEQGLKLAGFGALHRGKPFHERNLDHFTVFRNPDLVDQAELDSIVGILDGDADHAVADSERDPLEYPAVVVIYAEHLNPSCALQRHSGSACRTTTVPVVRHSRWAVTPWK